MVRVLGVRCRGVDVGRGTRGTSVALEDTWFGETREQEHGTGDRRKRCSHPCERNQDSSVLLFILGETKQSK